jgi:hypothetical protein
VASEPFRHGAVNDVAADADAVSVAPVPPTSNLHNPRSEGTPNRLPDAEAPWRRMLPPIKPPLQLPRREVDDTPTGDHLSI